MIALEEARERVLVGCMQLAPVAARPVDSVGCVLAEAVSSNELVPPFDNTAMDGFAVRADDTAGATESAPVSLTVVDTLPAGKAPEREVQTGEAIRIMTGAPMPPGADAVVMVELTRASADGATVEVLEAVPDGNHVRRAGDDMRPGDEVLPAGSVLGAGHIGVLATLGVEQVSVHPRARVGVFSTGDELVQGPTPLAPGQIRDSNRAALLVLVAQAGCEPVDLGLIRDDQAAIARAVTDGVAACDALITSGGVSMGDYDYVKVVLDRLGDMSWMQVAIKPAKPLAFGVVDGTPVFGLPGNPVSSMVSFELFARPALRRMMGHAVLDRPQVLAVADEDLGRRPDGKVHFMRVVANWVGGRCHIRSAGGQGSHQLSAMAGANALAVVPEGSGVARGDEIPVIPLD